MVGDDGYRNSGIHRVHVHTVKRGVLRKGAEKMTTDIEIITVPDIMELYGFKRDEVYKLLKVKGCPVLPRSETAPYRLIKDEFERWLRSRRV